MTGAGVRAKGEGREGVPAPRRAGDQVSADARVADVRVMRRRAGNARSWRVSAWDARACELCAILAAEIKKKK